MKNRDKVIVALDLESVDAALQMAEQIAPVFPFFKIGMKLFTQNGPSLVRNVLKFGKVFLDLKFYDIPSVVAEAVQNAAQLGVSLLTVHASGGSEMMKLCADRLRGTSSCRLLGVTVLTSFASLDEFGVDREIPDQVQLLAQLSYSSGMDGIVCSPSEVSRMRSKFPAPFLLVTPGIRSTADDRGDQKRVASPVDALGNGSDFLVIGRPIIAASDPVSAAKRIAAEIG